MPYDPAPAATAAVAFFAMYAAHGVGDHWMQTCGQAAKKALDGAESTASAVWHCAKHVLTWTATLAVFLAVAGWWLGLPLRPGWVAAGLALNAVTHFVFDLRTPLVWLVEHVARRGGYIAHVQVVRPAGVERTGPGTAIFHLDQSAHVAVLFFAALLTAGPPWAG